MKFAELLAAKDEALAISSQAKETRAQAEADVAKAIADDEEADAMLADAHARLKEFLAEKGHHAVMKPDGTLIVYHATDATAEGWAGYHPILGEAV